MLENLKKAGLGEIVKKEFRSKEGRLKLQVPGKDVWEDYYFVLGKKSFKYFKYHQRHMPVCQNCLSLSLYIYI